MKATERLRRSFSQPGVIRVAGAHNALGAHLVEAAGFDAVWSSGLEISTSYAVPDANILTMSEFLNAGQNMAEAVSIPVIADCDTGFGNSNNVIHMVRRFEAAGVAAVCIEDKTFPKVNSFVPGRQELAPIAEFVGKIIAAKSAQQDPAFMVIARVEALIAGWSMEEALRRARTYVEAGADAILIHSKSKTADEIQRFMENWESSIPVVVVPTTYYSVTAADLGRIGVKMVIYANHGLRASVRAMQETFAKIVAADSTSVVEEQLAPMSVIFDLQGMPQLKQDEDKFLRTGDPIRGIILAAGAHLAEPSMAPLTTDVPLTMLDLNGKSLLSRQAEVMNQCSIRDIRVVTGYLKERVKADNVTFVSNPQWLDTGELASLMCIDRPWEGRTLVAYADILFERHVLARLLDSHADITLLVDLTFDSKHYRSDRRIDLATVEGLVTGERRTLTPDAPRRVRRIGKQLPPQEANCEFTGLALFSQRGYKLVQEVYSSLSQTTDAPFHESPSVPRASLTDLIQELIDQGHEVASVEVATGWMEIRTLEDYRLASRLISGHPESVSRSGR